MPRDAAIQRFLLRFEQGDRNAGIREIHGDAAAHGAGADHGDASQSCVAVSCR